MTSTDLSDWYCTHYGPVNQEYFLEEAHRCRVHLQVDPREVRLKPDTTYNSQVKTALGALEGTNVAADRVSGRSIGRR
jgi:hypothetical protein